MTGSRSCTTISAKSTGPFGLGPGRACYRRALELDPRFAAAHHNLGLLLRALDRLPEAQQCYEAATRLEPNFAEAHNNLGNVLRKANCPKP